VFAVEGRQNLIAPEHNDELQKYITGIVTAQKHKLIAINNMPDHLHMLIGLRPDAALSDLVRDVKAGSSKFINEKHWVMGRFSWQEGFGAFSHARSQLDTVVRYIQNQQSTTPKIHFAMNMWSCWKSSVWITTRNTFSKPMRIDGQNMPLLRSLNFLGWFLQRCHAYGV
jgi:putative transposase